MTRSNDVHTALAAHVAACELCGADRPPIERIAAVLDSSVVAIDTAGLSQRMLAKLQPELARLTTAALWRRVIVAVLLALVPLPAVLAYDAYLLNAAYTLVSTLLPAAFAAYLVATYAAFLVLLFATTYAAIPLLLARRHVPRAAVSG